MYLLQCKGMSPGVSTTFFHIVNNGTSTFQLSIYSSAELLGPTGTRAPLGGLSASESPLELSITMGPGGDVTIDRLDFEGSVGVVSMALLSGNLVEAVIIWRPV